MGLFRRWGEKDLEAVVCVCTTLVSLFNWDLGGMRMGMGRFGQEGSYDVFYSSIYIFGKFWDEKYCWYFLFTGWIWSFWGLWSFAGRG